MKKTYASPELLISYAANEDIMVRSDVDLPVSGLFGESETEE